MLGGFSRYAMNGRTLQKCHIGRRVEAIMLCDLERLLEAVAHACAILYQPVTGGDLTDSLPTLLAFILYLSS